MKQLRFAVIFILTLSVIQFSCSTSTKSSDGGGSSDIGELILNPVGILVNQFTDVIINLIVPAEVEIPEGTARLARVDASGDVVEELGVLYDNGKLANGDEIGGDNIYSAILSFYETTPGDVLLQVEVEGLGNSETKTLQVYSDLTPQEFGGLTDTQDAATDQFDAILAGDINNIENAVSQTVQWLNAQPNVASAAYDGSTSIRVEYTSGLHGGIFISLEDDDGKLTTKGGIEIQGKSREEQQLIPVYKQTRGSIDPRAAQNNAADIFANLDPKIIGNRNVLIYAPFESYFGIDMAPTIKTILDSSDYEFSITHLIDQQADIEAFRNSPAYGLVIVDSHGSGGTEIGTGEQVDTSAVAYKDSYKALLKAKKLAIWKNVTVSKTGNVKKKADVYAIRPGFISGIPWEYPNSVIFNGSCESTKTNGLEQAFLGRGAKTYYGFNKVVNTTFCKNMADSATVRLAVRLKNTGEAFISGQTDPKSPNAAYELKGQNDVHYPDSLVNGNFELGNMDGWTVEGDGRVISKLVTVNPTSGSYMGIISTGLGYTTSAGIIFQSFRIDENQSSLIFSWNFLSEEFLEYIGSSYQDLFQVSIKLKDGSEDILLQKTVDWIAADFGASNGDPPVQGSLIDATAQGISFDQGGVFMTDWQLDYTYDVSIYRGQVVTLILQAWDVGDSIYDTAITLDDIKIQ